MITLRGNTSCTCNFQEEYACSFIGCSIGTCRQEPAGLVCKYCSWAPLPHIHLTQSCSCSSMYYIELKKRQWGRPWSKGCLFACLLDIARSWTMAVKGKKLSKCDCKLSFLPFTAIVQDLAISSQSSGAVSWLSKSTSRNSTDKVSWLLVVTRICLLLTWHSLVLFSCCTNCQEFHFCHRAF